ncbi:hypothetical protein N7481_009393 [Penicillium waksmanii]|uniref:uncharacterized protein n=1 Tax=Penicillium waksmanii TaxID=69791 RepID=UPI0025477DE9|nr:uncharacterized protein N7481_009393 [Penicillium waksmanii]KAJ5975686.1 hypothetical protein N7481_009393 [Penicillium waksmanii]
MGLAATSFEEAEEIWAQRLKEFSGSENSNDPVPEQPILNYLTISRDRTANSNYQSEQLVVLAGCPPSAIEKAGDEGSSKGDEDFSESKTVDWDRADLLRILDDSLYKTNELSLYYRSSASQPQINSASTQLSSSSESISSDSSRDLPKIPSPDSLRELTRQYFPEGSNTLEQPREAGFTMDSEYQPEDGSASESDETAPLRKLLQQMEKFRSENRRLREQISQLSAGTAATKKLPPGCQIFHRLGPNEISLYTPTWMIGDKDRESVLRLDVLLASLDKHLEKHPEIVFAVFKDYKKTAQHGFDEATNETETDTVPSIVSHRESIKLTSDDMVSAFKAFMALQPDFSSIFPGFDVDAEIHAPFLFWYHYRSSYEGLSAKLKIQDRDLMNLLTQWIEERYCDEYNMANACLAKGRVTPKIMKYLVRPGDVLVSQDDDGTTKGYISTSWLELNAASKSLRITSIEGATDRGDNPNEDGCSTPAQKLIIKDTYDFYGWYWEYDGSFYSRDKTITINIEADSSDQEIMITTLKSFPLKYADKIITDRLRRRGEMFWDCRSQKLVEYQTENHKTLAIEIERYVIDDSTYKRIHRGKGAVLDEKERRWPGARELSESRGPQDEEIYVFPLKITGYSLVRKSWVDLWVDQIYEVGWNKIAFDNLVVDRDTKELIQALVMNQVEAERGTDVIGGKGNGLIMLLHGGPGTGKTFTAEAVAEIAEKPLYRVTCGDIGTKPEDAEKYLESALHLGKIWGCVVLLDEADVFLEERSLDQLERNALVSVFLRVLEYYEGILILTSNRVGTFDEAFKSRIQLALHYKNLSVDQRQRIWWNFLDHLRVMERGEKATIDIDDILDHVSELANQFEMNGRQIRNVITTARQLAKHRRHIMNFSHLQHVINVSARFEKYLQDVKVGLTDDEVARQFGKR